MEICEHEQLLKMAMDGWMIEHPNEE